MKAHASSTQPQTSCGRGSLRHPFVITGLALLTLLAVRAGAQSPANPTASQSSSATPPETPTTLPNAPRPPIHDPARTSLWDDYYTAGVTCSIGASLSQSAYQKLWGCGGGVGFGPMWFEVGAFSPQVIQSGPTGYWTADALIPLSRLHPFKRAYAPARILPFATVGYTRLFQTANAIDYSVGADVSLNYHTSLRIEAKEYTSFLPQTQFNTMLRFTLVGWTPDP